MARLTLSAGAPLRPRLEPLPAAAARAESLHPDGDRLRAESDGVTYHDVTPRFGVAYDLFGNGKTALKVNIGKYLVAADGSSITGGQLNPLSRVSTSASRTWTDANTNFRPDCDLLNAQAQDLRAVRRRLLRPEQ